MIQGIAALFTHQLSTYRHQVLTSPDLLDEDILAPSHVEQVLALYRFNGRNRTFTPIVTLWTFLFQVLSPDGSCRDALSRLRAWMVANGQTPCSANTGSYCKARKRLPEGVILQLARDSGQRLSEQTPSEWSWKGRRVKLIDGSTVSMPDTLDNQAIYPQQRSQKPGLGFPLARILGIFDLASGALVTLGIGPYRGKETGESALLRQQASCFDSDDVALADSYHGSYWTLASFDLRGVAYVGRQHPLRKTDFRRGQRLGREDHIVAWHKPPKRPVWMDQAMYDRMPTQVSVRELRVRVACRGFRTRVFVVATTLLDALTYSAADLADLYRRRWHVELDLRAIKVALGMDVLRGQSPQMVHKELWMHMLAYNLIRTVMLRAAMSAGLRPRDLSFTGTLQAINGFAPALILADISVVPSLVTALLKTVAAHRVGQRPERVEPRAVKRRGTAHKLLTVPRQQARKRLMRGQAV